jgi:hypothetical protein
MSGNNQFPQSISVAYGDQTLTSPFSAPSNQQLLVDNIRLYNSTAAPNIMGIFHSISEPQYKLYKLLSGVGSDFTAEIQGGDSVSIFNTTNNDGFLVQSQEKFHMIAFNINQAQTGSPVYAYNYWNGSGFVDLTLLNTPLYSGSDIQAIIFNAPIDWVAGNGGTGADNSLYTIQVIATTAPSQAVNINSLKVGKMLEYSSDVPQSGRLSLNYENDPYLLQAGETIIPFFSYTNASNRLEITYKINP